MTYNEGMVRTQIYLPEELHRDLKLLANTEGVNFSSLIREGAEEVIKKKKKSSRTDWRRFVGAGKTGGVKTNAVKDIHDYYR